MISLDLLKPSEVRKAGDGSTNCYNTILLFSYKLKQQVVTNFTDCNNNLENNRDMAFFTVAAAASDLNLRICDEQGKAAEANYLLPQVVHFVMGSNSQRGG